MLQPGDELHGFIVKSTEELPEIDGNAVVMDHSASGAKLLYLKNDDENKAFSITFKTPPADDTGVFHILEHSVLCGSEKFPVKEPFVNLLRTSMQTFLNAMTFPDKTMYPVASTNEQDLLNLMDVYLDSVLNPKLHDDRHIFEQEGWHYEVVGSAVLPNGGPADAAASAGAQSASADEGLRTEVRGASASETILGASETLADSSTTCDSEVVDTRRLVYNGVVFNEMKGALSDPESVLFHAMNRALFPNTCYAFESGGHPRAIPQLTYKDYCDTHRRHYNLENSYIVLYGDMDIDRILGFLDDNYLGEACRSRGSAQGQEVDSPEKTISGPPNPIGEIAPVLSFDNVVEMATSPDNACVGLGYVIGDSHDFERVLAADILMDALMGGNESPIKRAVLDAGLGGDCTAFLTDSQAQPVALFLLKNAKPGVAAQFRDLVEDQVRSLVKDGIPRDVLEASLATMTFDLRERDRGIADGVALAVSAMSGWLYHDEDATLYLHYEGPLAHLRKGLEESYFEETLSSLVLDTQHAALVDLVAVSSEGETEEEAELAARLAEMDAADLEAIEREVAALRMRQEAPDTPEALATLPQLRVSDIGPAKPEQALEVRDDAPVPCLYHQLPTRNIDYLWLYFDLSHLNWDDIPYVTLLAMLLGSLDTERWTAAELDVHVRTHLGSLRFFADTNVDHDDPRNVHFRFAVGASSLSEELESLATLPREVWETTRFTDAARIRDRLVQKRIAMEDSFLGEGHMRSMSRVNSYLFESGVLTEALGGMEFYWFLKDLIDHFDERFEDLRARLEDVRDRVFKLERCTASFTGSFDDYDAFWKMAPLGSDDIATHAEGRLEIPAPTVKREAFTTPTDVCYVAKGADLGMVDYDGSWTVLGRVMGYDYLWNEVRVKGGAYGCGFRGGRSGFARFYSYRDPQIDATLARFDEAGKWLSSFDPDESELEGYIVSSVATHDAPVKPRLLARRQDVAYFAHQPLDWREHQRETLLATTPESVRALAPKLDAIAASDAVCVFGNAGMIDASEEGLNKVDLLES